MITVLVALGVSALIMGAMWDAFRVFRAYPARHRLVAA